MARMLGTCRQPFCGKCCGTKVKKATQVVKRSARRADKAELRRDLVAGRV